MRSVARIVNRMLTSTLTYLGDLMPATTKKAVPDSNN